MIESIIVNEDIESGSYLSILLELHYFFSCERVSNQKELMNPNISVKMRIVTGK